MQIRNAQPDDIPAITTIYRTSVLNEASSFEIDPPDITEMTRRWRAIVADGFAWLVAVSPDNRILGFCFTNAYRPRPAYATTVECSVYVHENARRKGVARELLAALIDASKTRGAAQMIAVIGDSKNTASRTLHADMGFSYIGTLEKVGRKFDRWIDVVLMQRALD